MSNDSTTPGYLTPTGSGPAYDVELERLISRWIRGLTGMDTKRVFPRWTDPQIQIPKNGTTWCAFGITGVEEDAYPAYIQADENAEQWSHETIEILCCFYGPQGMSTATQFRNGLFVAQNNDELKSIGLAFLDCGRIFNLPELINNQWVRRYDMTVRLRRKVVREYGIKSLVDAPVIYFGE